jgi:integrase
MANLDIDKTGLKRIRFRAVYGRRKTIRLGRTPKKDAETICNYVTRLETAQRVGTVPDADTIQWLARIADWLHSKLVQVGLVAEKQSATLGAFLEQYITGRSDIKPSTRCNLEQVKRNLLEFFGADRPLGSVTPGDADGFRVFLLERLADNTVRRNCGRAKQYFRAAQRKKLIQENPFADMKGCVVRENRSRMYFVSPAESQAVLDACPDAQWRLLFSLARYGGLRVPSEPLALKWTDVDWARNRFTVHSPKTEHHEGGESRQVPIFPELRPHLEEAFEQAEPGTEFVITRYRDSNANLRTQLQRIIRKAGLVPWMKPFQNCRSTRETELAETFPAHVVCMWIGNSQAVAKKHYFQTTEEHFRQAATPEQQEEEGGIENRGPIMDQLASVQAGIASYSVPATSGRGHEGSNVSARGESTLRSSTTDYRKPMGINDLDQAPRVGLEPTTQRLTAACSTN